MEKLSEERKQEIREAPHFKTFEALASKVLRVSKDEISSTETSAKTSKTTRKAKAKV